ncbi:MAG TPA: hypothetical protein VFV81_01680 [Verrucomicrobiae bacterium]|nr:hypothetical protein [Verrucomicrobiae bacterium]
MKSFSAKVLVGLGVLALGMAGASAASPSIAIVAPYRGQHVTSDTITVAGRTAYQGGTINAVYYQLKQEGAWGAWQLATPNGSWSLWTAPLSLTPGTNTVRAYAVASNGKHSGTNSVKFFYDTAQKSLKGLLMSVEGPSSYTIEFGAGTFCMSSADIDYNGAGTYTVTRLGGVSDKLKLKFLSPPTAPAKEIFTLDFDSAGSGSFYDTNGDFNQFTLDLATSNAPSSIAGTIELDDDSGITSIFNIPDSPLILPTANPFQVSNPLTIAIDEPYPGNIGDLVSVQFTHLVWNGSQWVQKNTPIDWGRVVYTNTTASGTNTVKVYFNNGGFVSHTDLFAPISGTPVTIWSYSSTVSDGVTTTAGVGDFSYRVYSPSGAMFAYTATNGTTYNILNFADDSSGTYAAVSTDLTGAETGTGTGSFTLLATTHTGGSTNFAPASVVGKTLVMTNGSGFSDAVTFSFSTFVETNAASGTNADGTYSYVRGSANSSTATLVYSSGPTVGYTNMISMAFTMTNIGSFVSTNYNASGGYFTNYSGSFQLQ